MNTAAVKLLAECRARGIALRPGEGGKLKVSPPPERLPAEIVAELKRHKAAVLALLQSPFPCPGCGAAPRLEPAVPEELPARIWTCARCDTWGATRDGAAYPTVWIGSATEQ
jgi:ribosomal protein L37AE/L43A